MARVRAALFDLDGTLVDSAKDLAHAVNTVLARRGLAPLPTPEIASFLGKGAAHLMRKVAAARGLTPSEQELEALVSEYASILVASNSRGTEFFPGVLDALGELRAAGVKTALVTNKMRAITEAFLRDRGVEALFDIVVAAGDAARPKPASDMLVLAMERLGVHPHECVMVGDSRNDALAGRAAGTRVLLVGTGYNEGEPIGIWARENGFPAPLAGIAQVVEDLISEEDSA